MNLKTLFAYNPHDSEEIRLEKFSIFILAAACSIAGTIWAITYYFVLGWVLTILFPALFTLFVGGALIISHFSKKHRIVIYTQIICIIYIPALIEWNIGGVLNSGFVMAWSFLGPLCALMFFSVRQSIFWLILFLFNIVISAVFNDFFASSTIIVPEKTRIIFFMMNLSIASIVVFIFASYYVNSTIKEQKINNDLLHENLQQELVLRQNEKLATLGKLSAGVAHELNNPAAATLSGAEQLRTSIAKLEKSEFKLGQLTLSLTQYEIVEKNIQTIYERAKHPVYIDALSSNDMEYEIDRFLEAKGQEDAFEISHVLVKIGYTSSQLIEMAKDFETDDFLIILKLFCNIYNTHTLIEDIGQGSLQITRLVKALKSYSYLDQGPKQSIDVHQGINDTLIMLRSKLKMGVQVEQEYCDNSPLIDAYGSELNQVWTNLIDNAISAMKGIGKITIRTYLENSQLVVEIIDNGPGIPLYIQSKIFDPFFTTKAPGEGTGLGLSISHNIITQKHKGQIKVISKPGETCFQVKLPVSI